jgi:hypothetical protein
MIKRVKSRIRRGAAGVRSSFRDRYEVLERRRLELLDRHKRLNDEAREHPGHRRALTLLNERFRGAKVVQRVAILQAAEWLINVLETLTLMA